MTNSGQMFTRANGYHSSRHNTTTYTHSHSRLGACEKPPGQYECGIITCLIYLFGLVVDLWHVDLFPGEELPDASPVVLISQRVQEDIEDGRGLSQDGGHLQRQVTTQSGC